MLRQAKNKCYIEGILSEIDLKYGSYVKDGRTVDTIGGSIKIRVNQTINGVNKSLEVPVYMFANRMTNQDKPNPAYESIEKVMKEYVSIASCGSEVGADKIRITSGQIRMNEYPNAKGEIVSYPRIYTSFINKATGEFRPKATWELEFAVSSMYFETDSDGVEVEPRKLHVKVIVPQYGNKVDTMELVTTLPPAIDSITSNWENQKTYTAVGRLNFESVTREIIIERDFGEPEVRVFTSNLSELFITGGNDSPLEDEMAFSPVELAAALKERKARLENLKSGATSRTRHTPAPTSAQQEVDLGF